MAALEAMENLRIKTRAFRDSHMQEHFSRSRAYKETRNIARMCSRDMMWGLVDLALTAEDERVRALSLIAVLDRGGLRPIDYDPDEEARDLHALPLEERKARLRELINKAGDLLSKPPARGLKKDG